MVLSPLDVSIPVAQAVKMFTASLSAEDSRSADRQKKSVCCKKEYLLDWLG